MTAGIMQMAQMAQDGTFLSSLTRGSIKSSLSESIGTRHSCPLMIWIDEVQSCSAIPRSAVVDTESPDY